MRVELSGTEVHTIECSGVVPCAAARSRVPASLALREQDGGAPVGLLVFAMRGLGATLPLRIGPRFDYGEVLWRIGVVWRGEPAWFAVACDLDRASIRTMGKWMVRYPTRRAAIDVRAAGASVRAAAGTLEVAAVATAITPDAAVPLPLLVGTDGALFRIPWREDPAPHRREAAITVRDAGLVDATLGAAVRWDPTGLVHAGRIHRCGIATRI